MLPGEWRRQRRDRLRGPCLLSGEIRRRRLHFVDGEYRRPSYPVEQEDVTGFGYLCNGIQRLAIFREIGRAHVCTPVTNAHLVCRLLLEKKKQIIILT